MAGTGAGRAHADADGVFVPCIREYCLGRVPRAAAVAHRLDLDLAAQLLDNALQLAQALD